MSDLPGMENLRQKFLAAAGERLTQLGEQICKLATSPADSDLVRNLGRELHTFKGDARLLGMDEMEHLVHAGEDVLLQHQKGSRIGDRTVELLYEAIDTIFVCVQNRLEGADVPKDEVERVLTKLRDDIAASPTPSVSAPEPTRTESLAPQPSPAAAVPPKSPVAIRPAEEEVDADKVHERVHQERLQVPTALLDSITDLSGDVAGGLLRSRQYIDRLIDLSNWLANKTNAQMLAHELASEWDEDETGKPRNLLTISTEISETLRDLREHEIRLGLTQSELTDNVRRSRLQAMRAAFVLYPPFVRRSAREVSKKIRLDVSGEDVHIEQLVLEKISEPCIHLLRNAVIHGIEHPRERLEAGKPEEGVISISASQDGETIKLEIADDGRGFDNRKLLRRAVTMGLIDKADSTDLDDNDIIQLAFTPGMSTASSVDEMAGRGIGLDVVSNVIDRLGGRVTVHSEPGKGCRFTLQVPVSLSLSRSLLVEVCEQLFAIPTASIVEVFRLSVKEILEVEGKETTRFHGHLLPLVRLREILQLKGIKDLFVNKVGVIVIRSGDEMVGVIVDRFLGEREIVIRPFNEFLGRPAMTSGVVVLEDGQIVLVLHAPDLLRSVQEENMGDRYRGVTAKTEGEYRILYAEDSIITREYTANVLRSRGFEVVEACDGVEAIQKLKQEKFDIVLTDLQMPRMDGFKLLASIRRDPQLTDLPVVVLSTLDTREAKQMALTAGADAYMVKSKFVADELVGLLRSVIG